jgi:1,4-dihydroxy-2-naphthoate octaprenyltransferase
LLIFLVLPLAVKAGRVALDNYDRTPKLIPANMFTILTHLLGGLLLVLGYFLHRIILG